MNQDFSEACRQESKVSHSFCESSSGGISEFFFWSQIFNLTSQEMVCFSRGMHPVSWKHLFAASANLFPAFLNPIIFELLKRGQHVRCKHSLEMQQKDRSWQSFLANSAEKPGKTQRTQDQGMFRAFFTNPKPSGLEIIWVAPMPPLLSI